MTMSQVSQQTTDHGISNWIKPNNQIDHKIQRYSRNTNQIINISENLEKDQIENSKNLH